MAILGSLFPILLFLFAIGFFLERGNGKRQPIFIRTADGKQHELV